MMLMVSANNLLSLYLGLEMQSLSLYVIASFNRDDERSTESGLKYFDLGAVASGMLLYGTSLVYGFGWWVVGWLLGLWAMAFVPDSLLGLAFVPDPTADGYGCGGGDTYTNITLRNKAKI